MNAYNDNPAPLLLAMYRRLADAGEIAPDLCNPALAVDIAGFRRYRGDWIGAVVTPWFLRLFLLPGGGELWRDVPPGERLLLEFPARQLEFVAEATAGAEVPSSLYFLDGSRAEWCYGRKRVRKRAGYPDRGYAVPFLAAAAI